MIFTLIKIPRTQEKMQLTPEKLLKRKNIDEPILLITSALHMPRAKMCFEKEKVNFIPFAVDRVAGPPRPAFDYYVFPEASNILRWYHLLHEIIGLISYKIAGYV